MKLNNGGICFQNILFFRVQKLEPRQTPVGFLHGLTIYPKRPIIRPAIGPIFRQTFRILLRSRLNLPTLCTYERGRTRILVGMDPGVTQDRSSPGHPFPGPHQETWGPSLPSGYDIWSTRLNPYTHRQIRKLGPTDGKELPRVTSPSQQSWMGAGAESTLL